MPQPKEYKDIKRWGIIMGSYAPYIAEQQAKAAHDNAPINAIYERWDRNGPTGVWATRTEISNVFASIQMDKIESQENVNA